MRSKKPKKSSKAAELARKFQKNAHAPYSGKNIGAAIVLKDGSIYGGCNIENASYGATVCAERVAIWKAVSEKKKIEIAEVYVVSPAGSPPWPPCGMCRQVMAEFSKPSTQVHCANAEGKAKSFSFLELFPGAFGAEYLTPTAGIADSNKRASRK